MDIMETAFQIVEAKNHDQVQEIMKKRGWQNITDESILKYLQNYFVPSNGTLGEDQKLFFLNGFNNGIDALRKEFENHEDGDYGVVRCGRCGNHRVRCEAFLSDEYVYTCEHCESFLKDNK
jgi:hypothetical protein